MEISVKQGNLTVIKSDSILVYNGETTILTIDGNYIIRIDYEDGSADDPQQFSITPNDEGIRIVLKNFDNPLGTASGEPILIAKQGETKIYIAFAVYRIGGAKILHYDIYTGK